MPESDAPLISHQEIIDLFDLWNKALKAGKPSEVVALYDDSAMLLPTFSDQIRVNKTEISDYFEQLLASKSSAELEVSKTRSLGHIAINSGVYVFLLEDGSRVRARYTFVYKWTRGQWLIIEHHSSQMPEVSS